MLGSRRSALALAQVALVKRAAHEKNPNLSIDVRTYTTRGDSITDVPLRQVGGTGIFTGEIETALLSGEIDIAVHSLKDVPSDTADGLCIAGVLERADPRDAFLSNTGTGLRDLAPGDTVGTSSLRRRAQLTRINPGAVAVDMRGNIGTRLRKLRDGHCNGIILAAAGLARAGMTEHITEYLRIEVMLPAPAQGIIGLETRVGDDNALNVVDAVNHDPTWNAAVAERSFLREVEGGCQIPIGCFAAVEGSSIDITGFISDIEGACWVKRSVKGSIEKSLDLGEKLAEEMLNDGGREILEIVRNGDI